MNTNYLPEWSILLSIWHDNIFMSVHVTTKPNFNLSSDAFRFTAMGQISNQRYLQLQQEEDIMSEALGVFSCGMLLLESWGKIPAAGR